MFYNMHETLPMSENFTAVLEKLRTHFAFYRNQGVQKKLKVEGKPGREKEGESRRDRQRERTRATVCIFQERGRAGLNWHLKEPTVIALCLIKRGKGEGRTQIESNHWTGASSSERVQTAPP